MKAADRLRKLDDALARLRRVREDGGLDPPHDDSLRDAVTHIEAVAKGCRAALSDAKGEARRELKRLRRERDKLHGPGIVASYEKRFEHYIAELEYMVGDLKTKPPPLTRLDYLDIE
jgi:hypothetical protein